MLYIRVPKAQMDLQPVLGPVYNICSEWTRHWACESMFVSISRWHIVRFKEQDVVAVA
jgi:hypothetical protein